MIVIHDPNLDRGRHFLPDLGFGIPGTIRLHFCMRFKPLISGCDYEIQRVAKLRLAKSDDFGVLIYCLSALNIFEFTNFFNFTALNFPLSWPSAG